MILVCLAIAVVALAVALVSLRVALAARKKLAAITAEQNERALKSERALEELTARSTSVEQRTTEDLARLRSDLATRLDAGLAQVQDALALEVAVQVVSSREGETS